MDEIRFRLMRTDQPGTRREVAVIRVRGAEIEIESADPDVAGLLAAIRQEPALDLYREALRPGPSGVPVRALALHEVGPGDPDYGYALSQEFSRRGPFEAAFD